MQKARKEKYDFYQFSVKKTFHSPNDLKKLMKHHQTPISRRLTRY